MFALTLQGGQILAMPDVCKVPAAPLPPIPTPFPNLANPMLASPVTTKVLLAGMPALTVASSIPLSSGDEGGSAGGVVSAVLMGKASFVQGSAKVMLEGKPAVCMGASTLQNLNNASGQVLQAGQTKVMING